MKIDGRQDDIPLGQVQLRWSDLDGPRAKYSFERAVAAPSDDTLHVMFVFEASLTLTVSISLLFVFAAILLRRKVRNNPFNVYLLSLVMSDLIYTLPCFVTCLLSAIVGHYYSSWMCRFQGWYLMTGFTANAWLNGAIAREIYILLRSSDRRMRYKPPTLRNVLRTSLSIFLLAGFVSTLSITRWQWIPAATDAHFGFVCAPIPYDRGSTIFFWLVLAPFYFLIPYSYVLWVFYDVVFRSKLFPPKGKRRDLALYFFRIGAVFAFLWGPTLFVIYVVVAPPMATFVISALSHTQGLISVVLYLLKPDIAKAAQRLLYGQCCTADDEAGAGESSDGDSRRPSSLVLWPAKSRILKSFRLSMRGGCRQESLNTGGTANSGLFIDHEPHRASLNSSRFSSVAVVNSKAGEKSEPVTGTGGESPSDGVGSDDQFHDPNALVVTSEFTPGRTRGDTEAIMDDDDDYGDEDGLLPQQNANFEFVDELPGRPAPEMPPSVP